MIDSPGSASHFFARLSPMEDDRVFVSLTNDPLNPSQIMDLVRSPEAGAIVLFAGTTRNNFQGKM
jgi:molybdopterin synthase catalytic subunit